MARIEIAVTMKGIYSYERPAYGYGTETAYIYSMEDKDGKVYVWKTTTIMGFEVEVEDFEGGIIKRGRRFRFNPVNKGDELVITAAVKGESEYKGQVQTELTRVKVSERTFKAKTWEEIKAEREAEKERKRQNQRDSLSGKDFIWRMPYKQYKEHYSDCETVEGSFIREGDATIEVIIREGRLKASGVRGEHYKGYEFFFVIGGEKKRICYRAVKEENALRHLQKDFPEATDIQPGKIYTYTFKLT